MTEELGDQIDKEAKQEAAAAIKFAEESPPPTIDDIQQDVYWEVDNETEAGRTGRHFFND
jgi:pyruvate dehydrogenase E1 component alpha subunit